MRFWLLALSLVLSGEAFGKDGSVFRMTAISDYDLKPRLSEFSALVDRELVRLEIKKLHYESPYLYSDLKKIARQTWMSTEFDLYGFTKCAADLVAPDGCKEIEAPIYLGKISLPVDAIFVIKVNRDRTENVCQQFRRATFPKSSYSNIGRCFVDALEGSE